MEEKTKTYAALLYGLQRTGTNYLEQLILQNFSNVQFYNDAYARCLPTHKHFRLYSEKSVIPQASYLNSFMYRDFKDFSKHVNKIIKREAGICLVTVKNPYSWYVSYRKHARRNRYTYFRKGINSHYIIDYNLFYNMWLDFSYQAPDRVLIVRYEDLIMDLADTLDRISDTFSLDRITDTYLNPSRVSMSKEFSGKRKRYYKNEEFMKLISDRDRKLFDNLLDKDLMSALNYSRSE